MKLDKSTYRPFGLEAIETASRDEIAAVQTKRLKRTLENVYENVPLYRRKFDAAGISPLDFKHLDDLKHFPFTTKQDLRENYPFGMFAVPKERVLRIHASSGHYRETHRRRLYSWGHRYVGGSRRALAASMRRTPWYACSRLCWLRSVHRRNGNALRCRTAWLHSSTRRRGDDA